MRKESSPRVFAAIILACLCAAHLSATLCLGSEGVSADPTITLNVQNEPLRSVLGKISKTTGWKIKAPEKWMDKRVTQVLTEVTLEKGVRYVLKGAGVENLLVTYDETLKLVTVFDTETPQSRLAGRPEAPPTAAAIVPPPHPPPTGRPNTESPSERPKRYKSIAKAEGEILRG